MRLAVVLAVPLAPPPARVLASLAVGLPARSACTNPKPRHWRRRAAPLPAPAYRPLPLSAAQRRCGYLAAGLVGRWVTLLPPLPHRLGRGYGLFARQSPPPLFSALHSFLPPPTHSHPPPPTPQTTNKNPAGVDMGEGSLSDLWTLQLGLFGDVAEWDEVEVVGEGPPARSYHAMAAIGTRIYVFGGCGEAGRLSDLWECDTAHAPPRWRQLPSSRAVRGRGGAGFCALDGALYVYGG